MPAAVMSTLPALTLELAHSLLPTIPLDKGVASANTGVLLLDALPLVTMLPCLPTLGLYWRRRRWGDFVAFGTGFLLAVIYHIAHMHPLGLGRARVLGLPGPAWRTLDILTAQMLLARTLGHALGVRTSLLAVACNLLFPTALMAYGHIVGRLTLGMASKVLLFIMLATLAGKATVEGWDTLPQYCPQRGKRALACFVAGFLAFPMPELFPRHYWLFHSIWHVCLAQGYNDLYLMLEGEPPRRRRLLSWWAALRRRRDGRRAPRAGAGAAARGWRLELQLLSGAAGGTAPAPAAAGAWERDGSCRSGSCRSGSAVGSKLPRLE